MSRHGFFATACVFLATLLTASGTAAVAAGHDSPTSGGGHDSLSPGSSVPSGSAAATQACSSGRGSALLQGESSRAQVDAGTDLAADDHQEPPGFARGMWDTVVGGAGSQPKLENTSVIVLERILKKEEGADSTALKDLQEAEVAGDGSVEAVVAGSDNEEIMKALEEISQEESPEEALDAGELITSELLKEVDGLTTEPEENPDAIQGDMMPGSDVGKLLLLESISEHKRWAGTLWPKDEDIPYCFALDIAPSSKKAFEHAVAHYEKLVPCLKFKEVPVNGKRCSQMGIVVTSDKPGCFASVGVWPAPLVTNCNLQPKSCDSMGIAVHELGHNLGMLHEQARSDSQDYVKILWDNIIPDRLNQYTINSANMASEINAVPYDIMSVMHYGDSAFGKPGTKTMESLMPTKKVMGNRMGLTFEDAQQVSQMYGCEASLKAFKTCTNHVDGCTKGPCECHFDPSGRIKFAKITEGECSRCLEACPVFPKGGTNPSCGCANGLEKTTFASKGKKFYNCKDPCADQHDFCERLKSYCGKGAKIGGKLFDKGCPKTCGMPCKVKKTTTTTTSTTTPQPKPKPKPRQSQKQPPRQKAPSPKASSRKASDTEEAKIRRRRRRRWDMKK